MGFLRIKSNGLKTIEQQCEEDLRNAHEKGYENPDFDYRDYYSHGDKIFYVLVEPKLGLKEIAELTISTVYPRFVVAYYEQGKSMCISYFQRERIFTDRRAANKYFDSIAVQKKDFTTGEFD